MARKRIAAAGAAFGAGVAAFGAASAHPGPKLLTAGANSDRAATTAGVAYEDAGGLRVFRGGQALAKDAQAKDAQAASNTGPASAQIKVTVITRNYGWRSFRRLRTQGFYSGTGPKSRRFTQGFYSGR